jgi:xylulokinase
VLREQWRAASPVVAHGVAVNRLVLQGKYASVLAQVCESAIPVSVQVQVPSEFAADGAALQAAWALQGSRPGWTPGLIN